MLRVKSLFDEGQNQRAKLTEPDFLILDEPLASLDDALAVRRVMRAGTWVA